MSLIFFDGFDHYTSSPTGKWTSLSGSSMVSTGGRRNSGYMRTGGAFSGYQWDKNFSANKTTLIFGLAIKIADFGNPFDTCIIRLLDGTTSQCELGVSSTGALYVSRNNSKFAYGDNVLSTSTFTYVEWKVTIGSSGSSEIRVNGNPTPYQTLSAINTQNTSNAYATKFTLGAYRYENTNYPLYFYVDDFYVCDNSGSTANTFLGDVRVDTIFPNGEGTYLQGTPSTGTTHYTLVDETSPNTTDYVTVTTATNRDSYNLQDLQSLSSQSIYGVQVNAYTAKTDGNYKTAASFIKSGATILDGTEYAPATSYSFNTSLFDTDPNTSGAWTQSAVNSIEAGIVAKS